jgi:hypothetical protein
MGLFGRKHKNQPKNRFNKITFSQFLDKDLDIYRSVLFIPPMDSDTFENYLVEYLLDDPECDYVQVMSWSGPQSRTQLLFDILMKYSPRFQKEWKTRCKNLEKC